MKLDLKTPVLYSKAEYHHKCSQKSSEILGAAAGDRPSRPAHIFTVISCLIHEPFRILGTIIGIALDTIFKIPFQVLSFNKNKFLDALGNFFVLNPLELASNLFTAPVRVFAAAFGVLCPYVAIKLWKLTVDIQTGNLWLKFSLLKKLELEKSDGKTVHCFEPYLAERYLGGDRALLIFKNKFRSELNNKKESEEAELDLKSRFKEYFSEFVMSTYSTIDWIKVLEKNLRGKENPVNQNKLDSDYSNEIRPLHTYLEDYKKNPDNKDKPFDSGLFQLKLDEIIKTLTPNQIQAFDADINTTWEVLKHSWSRLGSNTKESSKKLTEIEKKLTPSQIEFFEKQLGPTWKTWKETFTPFSVDVDKGDFNKMNQLNHGLDVIVKTITPEKMASFDKSIVGAWEAWKNSFIQLFTACQKEVLDNLKNDYKESENYVLKYGSARY